MALVRNRRRFHSAHYWLLLNILLLLVAAGEVSMLAAAVAQEDIGHRFLENLLVEERLLNQYSR